MRPKELQVLAFILGRLYHWFDLLKVLQGDLNLNSTVDELHLYLASFLVRISALA
jgi:hypothetical protein